MNTHSRSHISYGKAINEALLQAMEQDENVICFGLGVDDPKAIFGTTLGLKEKFGGERVFDMPTAENGMLGVAIGASLHGIRPVMSHQRMDFFLLAMDQLVNNAAKWPFMFGGKTRVPITIRLIVGRGWGQGPTHSQTLQAVFAHIPGLKVVMPAFPDDAKGLLLSSIFDPDPVIYIEHRWLHGSTGDVPADSYHTPLGKARIVESGSDITLVGMSIMSIEGLRAVRELQKHDISAELIDLRSIAPLDWDTIEKSVKKTGRLLLLETGNPVCSVSSEIIARVAMKLHATLKCAPVRLSPPSFPAPTSFSLTRDYYPGAHDIVETVGAMLHKPIASEGFFPNRSQYHDVPGDWFKGPF